MTGWAHRRLSAVAAVLLASLPAATGHAASAQDYCDPNAEQIPLECVTDPRGGGGGGAGDDPDPGEGSPPAADDGTSGSSGGEGGAETGGAPEDEGSSTPGSAGGVDLAQAIADSLDPDLLSLVRRRTTTALGCSVDPGRDWLDQCAPKALDTVAEIIYVLGSAGPPGADARLIQVAGLFGGLATLTRSDGTLVFPAVNQSAPFIAKVVVSGLLDESINRGLERWMKLILALDLQAEP